MEHFRHRVQLILIMMEGRSNMTFSGKWLGILVAMQNALVGVIKYEVKKTRRDQIMESVLYLFGLGLTAGLILKVTGVKMS